MKILLTGVAGFIGSHVAEKLLELGHEVVGIDNFDPFYARTIKERNIGAALHHKGFRFVEADICDPGCWGALQDQKFELIIHLAAKAGVRPSMIDPLSYNKVNITGTNYLLEFARNNGVKKVIFASSSSVYGLNKDLPWSVDTKDLEPISIYAFSKKAGEELCALYQNYFGLKILALRFFTVFGPRQRPDLAIHKFVKAITNGSEVPLYGNGATFRDYTFIDDIVSGIMGAVDYDTDKFEIFNLGNTHTVSLMSLVETIEDILGKKANIKFMPSQPGDVPYTWSDIEKSRKLLGYDPNTDLRNGIEKFINWYNTI